MLLRNRTSEARETEFLPLQLFSKMIVITALLALLANQALAQDIQVTRLCLDCICHASSGCYEQVGCIDGGGTKYCGPYLLSWGYWFDSGSPGLNFEKCAQNKTCAEAAVQGYMQRYGKDCDDDGVIDCDDFVRIHKRGYGACTGDQLIQTDYMVRFEMCFTQGTADEQDEPEPPKEDYGEGVMQERKGS